MKIALTERRKKIVAFIFLLLLVLFLLVLLLWINTESQQICPPRPSRSAILKTSSGGLEFYVDAENGDDDWKGTLIRPDENFNGPFKTIEGAIKGVRATKRSQSERATIYLLGGAHYITKTIELIERDSQLSIVGYPDDERPIISGAKRILGKDFKRYKKNIWRSRFRGICSKHVFLGNKRLFRARKPNLENWQGNEFTGNAPYLTIKDLLKSTPDCNINGTSGDFRQFQCADENKRGFKFSPGDLDPEWLQTQNGSPIDILVFGAWIAERAKIRRFNNDRVIFTKDLTFAIGDHHLSSNLRYIVENVRTELDAVGEVFCDEEQGFLYVIPPEGALSTNDVHIAQTSTLFSIRDAKQISFVDLEFRHSHDDNEEGHMRRPALLDFVRCNEVYIRQCKFFNVGHVGLLLQNVVNAEIIRNKFEDIGFLGITTLYNGNSEDSLSNRNHLIERNTLTRCGVTNMFQPACMWIQGVEKIKVQRNEISHTPYAGIRVGWQPTFNKTYLPKGKHVFYIEKNHVHNYGSGLLNDFGGIYISTNTQCGTTERSLDECNLFAKVSENVIHSPKPYYYGGVGVYGDTGASTLTVTNNWLFNLTDAAINFHCGINNQAINNMIHHTTKGRVFGTCKLIGPRSIPKQTLTLLRNVVYVANSQARMYGHKDIWINDPPNVNNNNYFFNPTSERGFNTFFPKKRSWEDWRSKTGSDSKSIISDPKYSSIDHKDLRLQGSSPALNLGIYSIDLRSVITQSGSC